MDAAPSVLLQSLSGPCRSTAGGTTSPIEMDYFLPLRGTVSSCQWHEKGLGELVTCRSSLAMRAGVLLSSLLTRKSKVLISALHHLVILMGKFL